MRCTRLLQRVPRPVSAYSDQTPGCAAAVVRAGRTLYACGFGLADLSHRVRIAPDTVFEIGSVSKQFTAVAILPLEADGKLRLDDSVQQHLPELAPLAPVQNGDLITLDVAGRRPRLPARQARGVCAAPGLRQAQPERVLCASTRVRHHPGMSLR